MKIQKKMVKLGWSLFVLISFIELVLGHGRMQNPAVNLIFILVLVH
jgi:hypothetical protein